MSRIVSLSTHRYASRPSGSVRSHRGGSRSMRRSANGSGAPTACESVGRLLRSGWTSTAPAREPAECDGLIRRIPPVRSISHSTPDHPPQVRASQLVITPSHRCGNSRRRWMSLPARSRKCVCQPRSSAQTRRPGQSDHQDTPLPKSAYEPSPSRASICAGKGNQAHGSPTGGETGIGLPVRVSTHDTPSNCSPTFGESFRNAEGTMLSVSISQTMPTFLPHGKWFTMRAAS